MTTEITTAPHTTPSPAPAAAEAQPPRWDLSDLYTSLDDPAIDADCTRAEEETRAFASRWRGRIAAADAADLAQAIAQYQTIDERLGRLGSFSQLAFAAQSTDPACQRFAQNIRERLTAIATPLVFFTLEINRLEDTTFDRLTADPALTNWTPYLRDLRVFRPYQLSDELEQTLMEKSVTGRAAWNRLFDETMATLTVSLDGAEKPLGDAFNALTDADRTRRAAAAAEISRVLGQNNTLLTMITNVLAKDKAIDDGLRHLPRPSSSRNLSNMVEDNVVDALVSAVEAAYPRLSHRYYSLKAKWLGLETMQHWDRNAPLPGAPDRRIGWTDATQIVQRAYQDFDPRLGELVRRFFENPWIDAAAVPGKSSGAFAHPTVPSAHPYVLMNYHGRARDVMTLAHELGHGAHQILAGKQGYLQSSTPLTLAETASVFGEMLTFKSLLAAETDAKARRFMLAAKVEDMLNTVVRQIAFYQFEVALHDERRKGEVPAERIGTLWREVQASSLGPAFTFSPDYDLYWSYIPHFVHSPFYVYAYAFGDCLVNALYGVYEDGLPDFADKYIAMLEAGGTLRHRELLAPFGLDASDPQFWRRGLDVISGLIDELEAAETEAELS